MTKRASLLLATVLALVSLLAACADGSRDTLVGRGDDDDGDTQTGAATTGGKKTGTTATGPTETVDGKDPNQVGPLPTNVTAKQYFTQNVHPALTSCSGCHSAGPAPAWIVAGDAEKSYTMVFGRGYIIRETMLIKKGVHNGGAGAALTPDQSKKVATWIELEMKERGDKAPPTVLSRLAADCLSEEKYDAIGWDKIQTVTRNANNNPNGETENADECTGCKPVTCAACHSGDPATGFMVADGNTIFEKGYTFKNIKKTAPPYLQKYFGLDTNGDPKASESIRLKSDNTVNVAKAYQHPMYKLTAAQEQAIDDFVADAITKFKAGTCGKAEPAAP